MHQVTLLFFILFLFFNDLFSFVISVFPSGRLTLGDNPYSGLPLLPPGLGVGPAGRRLKHLHLDSAGLKELPAPVLQCR